MGTSKSRGMERNRQTVNLWSRQLLNEAIRNTVQYC